MIIVSQDKRDILNLNFTQRIGLDNETNFSSIVAYQNGNASAECLWLGSYATEERAKEVLQEITEIFTDEEMFHINKSSLNNLDELEEPKYILRPTSKPKVYYMPED